MENRNKKIILAIRTRQMTYWGYIMSKRSPEERDVHWTF